MPPCLLLTRPQAASTRFATQLAHLGLKVVISPILRIAPMPHDAAALAQAVGLVFTSVNAVPAAGPGQGRPAICVGPATAQAARDAGFKVTEGPGDAARMMPLLTGLGAGWLHPHGAHLAAQLPVPGMVVYDQVAQPLTSEARGVLMGDAAVIVPLFSPRSARLISDAARAASAPLWIAPISPAAAESCSLAVARVALAPRPDAVGVQAAVETLVLQEQSGWGRVEARPAGD